MSQPIFITKADGSREPWKREKLVRSLTRSGASPSAAERITKEVESALSEGDTTARIYKCAHQLLKKYERSAAPRYSLKRALFDLGPTGYPFEDFVAEIFRAQGYTAQTRVFLDGTCAVHEVDLVAEKDDRRLAAEIKFHNAAGLRSDLKTSLYVQARAADIETKQERDPKSALLSPAGGPITEWWLITNTKFTSQAQDFGTCAGLEMVSWNRPAGNDLQDMIEDAGVHPLTCLTTLSKAERKHLLEDNIVLCRNLPMHTATLRAMGLSKKKIDRALEEAAGICGG